MAIVIVGWVVKARKRARAGEKLLAYRDVSNRFAVQKAAEEFKTLYAKAHPGDEVIIESVYKNDGIGDAA